MARKQANEAKFSFPLDLSRRQFLRTLGFIAGAGASFASGFLRRP
ncbi:hypothetical protein [Leptolyngbya sp. FACHB-16]|nr:hypothetical protein [Leptolyngbya sp. FACHB-16]